MTISWQGGCPGATPTLLMVLLKHEFAGISNAYVLHFVMETIAFLSQSFYFAIKTIEKVHC